MIEQNEGFGVVIEKYLREYYEKGEDSVHNANVYNIVMQEVEKRLISVTLDITKGNRIKTAQILGINRNTLLAKMRKFDLDEKYLEQQQKTKLFLSKRRRKK